MCPRGPGTSTLETQTLRQRETCGGQVWGTEQAPSRAVPLSVGPRWGFMGPIFLKPSHSCLDVTTQHGQSSCPSPLLPILRFYYQADSGPWLPPSQLPKQFKPLFPISAVGIHCCLKD